MSTGSRASCSLLSMPSSPPSLSPAGAARTNGRIQPLARLRALCSRGGGEAAVDSSVSLHLKNIFRWRVIACPPVEKDGLGGSVSQGCSLQGPGFLPPLQKQRVGGIFDLFYLDLLIVDTHCGQGTGHLLLAGRGHTNRDVRDISKGRMRATRAKGEGTGWLVGPGPIAASALGWVDRDGHHCRRSPQAPNDPTGRQKEHWPRSRTWDLVCPSQTLAV